MKGSRQFTRKQRVEIVALLIDAAKAACPAATGTSSAARAQLGQGLTLLSGGKIAAADAGNIAGLYAALKDQATANTSVLATAWEAAVFPAPIPVNKKTKDDALVTVDSTAAVEAGVLVEV